MAAIKKNALVLDVAAIEEDFFDYASIYGLRFSEAPYYCAWFLNNHLGTNFERNKSFFRQNESGFDLYEFFDRKTSLEHLLYTNHREGNYMIREMRGFQYFWMVKGEDFSYIYMNQMKQRIEKSFPVLDLQLIDIDKITNKSLFIF
jgi:hypothetical protein